jgi:hypothetical protein
MTCDSHDFCFGGLKQLRLELSAQLEQARADLGIGPRPLPGTPRAGGRR